TRGAPPVDPLRELPPRWVGEDRAHVGLPSLLPQPVDQRDHEQRVAAEFEEIVVAGDMLKVQEITPYRCDRGLDRPLRRFRKICSAALRRRESAAVELAV